MLNPNPPFYFPYHVSASKSSSVSAAPIDYTYPAIQRYSNRLTSNSITSPANTNFDFGYLSGTVDSDITGLSYDSTKITLTAPGLYIIESNLLLTNTDSSATYTTNSMIKEFGTNTQLAGLGDQTYYGTWSGMLSYPVLVDSPLSFYFSAKDSRDFTVSANSFFNITRFEINDPSPYKLYQSLATSNFVVDGFRQFFQFEPASYDTLQDAIQINVDSIEIKKPGLYSFYINVLLGGVFYYYDVHEIAIYKNDVKINSSKGFNQRMRSMTTVMNLVPGDIIYYQFTAADANPSGFYFGMLLDSGFSSSSIFAIL